MGIVGCWFQPLQMLLVLWLCISILCSAFWVDNSESTEREFDVGVDDNYVKKTGHRLSYDIPDSAHRSGVKHRLRRSTFGFTEIDHKADEESTEREFDVGVDDNYVKKTGHRLSYDIPDSAHRSGVKHRLRRSTFGFTEIDHKADEGYGSWSKWSKCSKNCGIGWQFRRRICYNTRHCRNGDLEEKICEGIRC